MKKPTSEQVKELWERCGWRIVEDIGMWYSVDPLTNRRFMGTTDKKCFNLMYPPLDLNNLFKYAVPKLTTRDSDETRFDLSLYYLNGKHKEDSIEEMWVAAVGNDNLNIAIYRKDKDPALALFWAIYETIKGEE